MIWSNSAAIGLTAGAVALLSAAIPVQAGPGDTWTRAQELWPTTSTATDVGMAVSGDGKKAVIMADGKASMWTQQSWGEPQRVPKGKYSTDHPQIVMSANGKRTVAAWGGGANEGVDMLYRSTKVGGGRWTSEMYGNGQGQVALGTDGGLAALGWYEVNPDDGVARHMYVSTWDGMTWSEAQDVGLPGQPFGGDGPVVAVDADSSHAVAAWTQGDSLQVSLYDGAWVPANLGPMGRVPLAAAFDSITGNAIVITGRLTGVNEMALEQATVTPAGIIAMGVMPIGLIPVGEFYDVDVQLSSDGGTGLAGYYGPDGFEVATWTPEAPFTVHVAGAGISTAALAAGGGRALITTMTDSADSPTSAVGVSTWDGSAWSGSRTVGTCKDRQVAGALSAAGTTVVAGWSCNHIHAVRSPKPPAVVKRLSATVTGKWAKVRWKTAKNSDSYQYKVKGRRAPQGWQDTMRTRAKVRVVPGSRYRLQVRGTNVGGPGPISTLRFR